jgi:hypothetical protein
VLGNNIQVTGDGNLANEENTSYIYIKSILEADDPIQGNSSNLPSIMLPLSLLTLGDVVKSLIATLHHNGMAGIFSIGMSISIAFNLRLGHKIL